MIAVVVAGVSMGALIDLRTRRVPNALTIGLAGLGFALAGLRESPDSSRCNPVQSFRSAATFLAIEKSTAFERSAFLSCSLSFRFRSCIHSK